MYKKKGVLTIFFSFFVVIIITLSLLLLDYARVYSAVEKAEAISDNAVDVGLSSFDEELHKNFHLFAVKDTVLASSRIETAIKDSLSQRSSKIGISNLELVSVKVDFSQSIADNNALKAAILKAHKKEAVVTRLAEYIEKLEVIKNLSKYSAMIEEYTELIKSIYEIRDTYDRCVDLYNDLNSLYTEVKNIDYKSVVTEVVRIKKELKKAKEDSVGDTDFSGVSGVSSETRLSIELSKFNKKLLKLEHLEQKIIAFTSNVAVLSDKLVKLNIKISDSISKIEKFNLDKSVEILSVIRNTLEKTRGAADSVLAVLNKLDSTKEQLKKKVDKIKNAVSSERILFSDKQLDQLLDFNRDGYLKELFSTDMMRPELNIQRLVKTIYNLVSGKMFPNRQVRGDVPADVSLSLEGLNATSLDEFPDSHSMGKKALEVNSLRNYSSVTSSFHRDLSFSKELFNKFVIADYALSVFTYDDSKKFSGSGKSPIYGAEIEYILSGRQSSLKNLLYTDLKIYSIRMVLNAVSIMAYKADDLNKISMTLSSWTGFVSYPVVYALVVAAWSGVESYIDINTLHNSYAVPIIKSGSEIYFSFSLDSLKRLLSTDKINEFSAKRKVTDITSFDYKEYLLLLLLFESETDTLNRIRDLYYMNNKFVASDYSTVVMVDIRYRIHKLLPNAYFSLGLNHIKDSYIYDVRITRGY